MNAFIKKVLYTLVFSLECIILFLLTFWLSEQFFPGSLLPVDAFREPLLLRLILVFSTIVFVSFYGASYVVYGNLKEPTPGKPKIRPSRKTFSPKKKPPAAAMHRARTRPPRHSSRPSMRRRPTTRKPIPKRLRSEGGRSPQIRP